MASSSSPLFTPTDLIGATAEDVFAKLLMKANGGTKIHTMAAPALSTQFVKSQSLSRARAGEEGALADLIFPSKRDVNHRLLNRHGADNTCLLGYDTTSASDAYCAGFGERSAESLAREENTYQLKGTFASAMSAFSRLRARIECREGDVDAADQIFARMWGLDDGAMTGIPHLHVEGSEATRVSAMEDRAYHALSGHPGHHGGYRVDMATIAPDALGPNVPLNWPRIRTGLKAIALCQLQGDVTISKLIRTLQEHKDYKFAMGLVQGSQSKYERPLPWEVIMRVLMDSTGNVQEDYLQLRDHGGLSLSATYHESFADRITLSPDYRFDADMRELALTVTRLAQASLKKTADVLVAHDKIRETLNRDIEADYDEFDASELTTSFVVPRYKITRTTIYKGVSRQESTRDNMPDIRSQGRPGLQLDLREFREAHLGVPVNISGALNMAVFLTVLNHQTLDAAYMMMHLVPDPRDGSATKAAIRLRRQDLYATPQVRRLGPLLFGDQFMNTFELLVTNMSSRPRSDDIGLKGEIWEYLSRRCPHYARRKCPTLGGWKDLLLDLRDMAEGWSLYYWVRITIGKKHNAVSDGILAPLAAGEATDFLTIVRRGIQERANKWKHYYAARYKVIENRIESCKQAQEYRAQSKVAPSDDQPAKIPSQLRKEVDLEQVYNADAILNRTGGFDADEYREMVEMQSKSKFFGAISVQTLGSKVAVGISDTNMLSMLVEFYQARWYSLHKRIEKATAHGKVFRLGMHEFPEHPWGPLVDQYPNSCPDMLAFMKTLDERAWTLDPSYLQDKFRKSIQELWEDIAGEIMKVSQYIIEVYDGLAEDQEDQDIERHQHSVLRSMSGLPAIPLPAPSYTPPFMMPAKPTTVFDAATGDSLTVPAIPMTYAQVEDACSLDNDDLEDVDDYDVMVDMDFGSGGTVIECIEQQYLTFNEIWKQLGLPDMSDARKRLAIGLPADQNLDEQHLDSTIAPTITTGEANLTVRRWANKVSMINYRLGQTPDQDLDVDM